MTLIGQGPFRSVVFVLVGVFFSLSAASTPKIYIQPADGFWSRHKVIVDGSELGNRKLSEALAGHPEAAAWASKHESYQFWSTALLIGGLGAAVIYGTDAASSDDKKFDSSTYWTIFLAGAIPSIALGKYAQIYAIKAMNSYNGIPATGASMSSSGNSFDGVALKISF